MACEKREKLMALWVIACNLMIIFGGGSFQFRPIFMQYHISKLFKRDDVLLIFHNFCLILHSIEYDYAIVISKTLHLKKCSSIQVICLFLE